MSPIWVKFLGNWGEITLKIDRFMKHLRSVISAYVTLKKFTPGLQKIYTDISAISATYSNSAQLRERKRLRYMVLGSQSIGTRPQWLWWRLWSRYYKCKFSSQDLTFIYIFVCPQVCLIFLTFLHSKVRKNDKIASRQNSVNHHHRVDFYTGCKITHEIHIGCPR